MTSDQAKTALALRLQRLLEELVEKYVTEPVAESVTDEQSEGIIPQLEGIQETLGHTIFHQLVALEQSVRDLNKSVLNFNARLQAMEEMMKSLRTPPTE